MLLLFRPVKFIKCFSQFDIFHLYAKLVYVLLCIRVATKHYPDPEKVCRKRVLISYSYSLEHSFLNGVSHITQLLTILFLQNTAASTLLSKNSIQHQGTTSCLEKLITTVPKALNDVTQYFKCPK